jgi:Domain of unknown function (DUF222)
VKCWPRIYGRVAAAQANGSVAEAAAGVIVGMIDKLPDALRCAKDVECEQLPVQQAWTLDLDRLQQVARQRRHDAWLDGLKLLSRAELLPDAGGVSTVVTFTMSLDAFQAGEGTATTGHGVVLPAKQALMWLDGETKVVPIVFDRFDRVDAIGRGQRLFTERQRLAMAARDGGCCFSGCDAPPQWTKAHHVIEYAEGGPTCTDNGCLLCGVHHREFERMGWRVTMTNGVPQWIPPIWIDPTQTPRTNTTHRPTLS